MGQSKEKKREIYHMRKAQGLCVQCGKPNDNGKSRCEECLEYHRWENAKVAAYQKEWKQAHKDRQREYTRKWESEHPEELKERRKEYNRRHREKRKGGAE